MVMHSSQRLRSDVGDRLGGTLFSFHRTFSREEFCRIWAKCMTLMREALLKDQKNGNSCAQPSLATDGSDRPHRLSVNQTGVVLDFLQREVSGAARVVRVTLTQLRPFGDSDSWPQSAEEVRKNWRRSPRRMTIAIINRDLGSTDTKEEHRLQQTTFATTGRGVVILRNSYDAAWANQVPPFALGGEIPESAPEIHFCANDTRLHTHRRYRLKKLGSILQRES